jgi:tRNA A-37 threonylcarbamoyl transferase component Bud32
VELWSCVIPKFYGISDSTELEDGGTEFLVLERVVGVTLARMPYVPYDVRQAARRSLSRLHKAGVAHGDVR